MSQEKYATISTTLEFYKDSKIKVHINITSGKDMGHFRNGYILMVDADKREFLIVDDVLGNRVYSFYEINEQIVPAREKV